MDPIPKSTGSGTEKSLWQPKWPWNISDLHLTRKEKNTLHKVAIEAKRKLDAYAMGLEGGTPRMTLWKGNRYEFESGDVVTIPRSMIVTCREVVILLNTHGGMPLLRGGSQRTKITYAWDLTEGAKYVKKKVCHHFEAVWVKFLSLQLLAESTGFPKISLVYKRSGETKFLEKYYPYTVSEFYPRISNVDLSGLLGLEAAVRKLHKIKYVPPTIFCGGESAGEGSCQDGYSGKVFHGDISPGNLTCSYDRESGNLRYTLIDFGASADFTSVLRTPGWVSPETARFLEGKSGMNSVQFNRKYGQKRDVWNLGLLVGSILRRNFLDLGAGPLPYFSSIGEKIEYMDGTYDDSAMGTITQRKIDKNISQIVKNLDQEGLDAEKIVLMKKVWGVVHQWLTVDPDDRPLLSEASLLPLFEESSSEESSSFEGD